MQVYKYTIYDKKKLSYNYKMSVTPANMTVFVIYLIINCTP